MVVDGTERPVVLVAGTFRFRGVPADVQRPITKVLKQLRWMLPTWVDHVNIHFCTDKTDGESNAEVTTEYAYRWASIMIYSSWLLGSEEDRLEDLKHEIYHIILAPMAEFASRLLKELGTDSASERMVQKEHIERVESVVQDLTHSHKHVDITKRSQNNVADTRVRRVREARSTTGGSEGRPVGHRGSGKARDPLS